MNIPLCIISHVLPIFLVFNFSKQNHPKGCPQGSHNFHQGTAHTPTYIHNISILKVKFEILPRGNNCCLSRWRHLPGGQDFSLVSRPLVLTGVDQALTTGAVEVQCTELSIVEGTKKLEPFYFFGPTYLSGHWAVYMYSKFIWQELYLASCL